MLDLMKKSVIMMVFGIFGISLFKYLVITHPFLNMPHRPPKSYKEYITQQQICHNELHTLDDNLRFKISSHEVVTRVLTSDFIEFLAKGWKDTNIEISWISVLSSPLEGPYLSSPDSVSKSVQGQWTDGDYHAFITFCTTDDILWALDKNATGIYLSWSNHMWLDPTYTVASHFSGAPRATPITFLSQCDPRGYHYNVQNITHFLENELSRPYRLIDDNCQSFAKRAIKELVEIAYYNPILVKYVLLDIFVLAFIWVILGSIYISISYIIWIICTCPSTNLTNFLLLVYVNWTCFFK